MPIEPALALNLLSVVAMCKAAVPSMQERKWGRVVAITSIAVRQPIETLILSNTARTGATGFLKSVAREVACDGVTVNSVQPGLHDTDRLVSLYGGDMLLGGAGIPAGLRRAAGRLRCGRRIHLLGTREVPDRLRDLVSTAARYDAGCQQRGRAINASHSAGRGTGGRRCRAPSRGRTARSGEPAWRSVRNIPFTGDRCETSRALQPSPLGSGSISRRASPSISPSMLATASRPGTTRSNEMVNRRSVRQRWLHDAIPPVALDQALRVEASQPRPPPAVLLCRLDRRPQGLVVDVEPVPPIRPHIHASRLLDSVSACVGNILCG